jgi:exosortase A
MNSAALAQTDGAKGRLWSWRAALGALGLQYLWIAFLFRDTAASMWGMWMRSETFAHCVLILPISLWMIWNKRDLLSSLSPRPSVLPLLLMPVVGMGWLLGELVAVNALTQFMFVTLIVLCVPATLGLHIARQITFPLAYLFFAVPFGEFVMPYMMIMTADFTVWALKLSGIPVYRENLHFIIPSGSWSVVEACSGVRYLIASFSVGTLYAYLSYRSPLRRVVFGVVSLLVPIIANWLRAYIIVMLGHLSGNKLAAGVDHLIYGWLFFGIVIMVMFAVGARWREDLPTLGSTPVGSSIQSSPVPVAIVRGAVSAAVTFVLAALPIWANAWILERESKAPVVLVKPAETQRWRSDASLSVDWKPAFARPSADGQWEFRNGDSTVGVYLGYYRNQDYERKLISSTNVLVKSNDRSWAQVSSGSEQAEFAERRISTRTAILRDLRSPDPAGARLLVRQVYWLDGQYAAGNAEGKLRSALARLTGRGDESAVLMFYASTATPGGAEAAVNGFMRDMGGSLVAALEETRKNR